MQSETVKTVRVVALEKQEYGGELILPDQEFDIEERWVFPLTLNGKIRQVERKKEKNKSTYETRVMTAKNEEKK